MRQIPRTVCIQTTALASPPCSSTKVTSCKLKDTVCSKAHQTKKARKHSWTSSSATKHRTLFHLPSGCTLQTKTSHFLTATKKQLLFLQRHFLQMQQK